jgi:phenylalanyl-tRNA synthetase beta chain
MKFSWSWLRTWLETEAGLDEVLATLNTIGLEVEGVENKAAALAPFVIAEVIEARPHPNADRLRVCRVNAGGGELSVVCGERPHRHARGVRAGGGGRARERPGAENWRDSRRKIRGHAGKLSRAGAGRRP